ncbi:MAG: hypothetical protein OCD02_19900 [Spirochaetaceae bacterium]
MYDTRNEIWNSTWNSYYDTFYQELLAEELEVRWKRFDDISRILIAITASTSAISGWALWSNKDFKIIWVFLAAIGALLSLVTKSLDIPRRISDWNDSKKYFTTLRIDYQIFLDELGFNPEFSTIDATVTVRNLRLRYAEGYKEMLNDSFITQKLKIMIQDSVNNNMKQ